MSSFKKYKPELFFFVTSSNEQQKLRQAIIHSFKTNKLESQAL